MNLFSCSSESMFQILSLDDFLEPMLCKRHGNETMKSSVGFSTTKTTESTAYRGQVSARYSLLSVAYMQQALGALLSNLQSENVNIDSTVQSVHDIFAMSTKALHQVGRTGAFHHITCRKSAASNTVLISLKEGKPKVMYLPL